MSESEARGYAQAPKWRPGKPRLRPVPLLVQWLTSAVALYAAAYVVPGVAVVGPLGALEAALLIAVLNALLPPLIAALRLPYMLALGFLLVLVADALMVMAAARLSDHTFAVDSFTAALLTALVASALAVALHIVLGTDDDDMYTLRVTQRIARRSRVRTVTDTPGRRRPECRAATAVTCTRPASWCAPTFMASTREKPRRRSSSTPWPGTRNTGSPPSSSRDGRSRWSMCRWVMSTRSGAATSAISGAGPCLSSGPSQRRSAGSTNSRTPSSSSSTVPCPT